MSGARDYMGVVRGLLAKAESTDNPAEAEAFLAKAQELMTRHAIDEAMVDRERRDRSTVETATILCQAPYSRPKWILLSGIALPNDCRAVRMNAATPGVGANSLVKVVGYRGDLEHVEALYTSLAVQAATMMMAQPDTRRKFRSGFLVGFAHRIAERLEEARKRASADYERDHASASGSVALVLADKRQLVEHAFRTQFPNTRNTGVRTSSGEGRHAGTRAANRADIGHGQLSARRSLPGG